ncbi:TPA: restriction endonuclease subunit S [Vibrio vulnificus]|nr:restriction endonuclease subunit S [Vibrio vulnificus]
MTGRYKAYAQYQDSGIEWLKDMPIHWQLVRAKHLFKRVQRPVRPEDGIVTAFRDGEVTLRSNRRTDGFTNAAKEIGYQGVRKGDLLVHAMDGFAGAIGMSDSDGKCSPVCSVCVPWDDSAVDTNYYGYLVRQLAVTDYITSLAKGIRERSTEFRFNEFSSLPLAVPPYEEQQKIANFLNHETAKINTLIVKQEKLIELLKEKRRAVISHAVTKGLNPDVPMKDSGVEWLGEVPEHWEVSKLKFESAVIDCRNKTPEYFEDGEYFVVRTTNVKNQKLNFDGALYTNERDFKIWTQRGVPPVGSILFTREAPMGEVCLVPDNLKFCMGQRMMNFIAHDESYSNYLFDYLISDCLERYIGSVSHGSTVSHLRVEQVENIPVLVPPQNEIMEIHSEISKLKRKYDALEVKAVATIGLMKERKTALISAAVTGKIDVRDWAGDC